MHPFGGYLDMFLCDIWMIPMSSETITAKIFANMSIHFVFISIRE